MSGPTGLIFAMRSRYGNILEPKHSTTKQICLLRYGWKLNNTSGFGNIRWFCTTNQTELTHLFWTQLHSLLLTTTLVRVWRLMLLELWYKGFQPDGILNREGHSYCRSRALKLSTTRACSGLKAIHGLNAEAELLISFYWDPCGNQQRSYRTIYKTAEQVLFLTLLLLVYSI